MCEVLKARIKRLISRRRAVEASAFERAVAAVQAHGESLGMLCIPQFFVIGSDVENGDEKLVIGDAPCRYTTRRIMEDVARTGGCSTAAFVVRCLDPEKPQDVELFKHYKAAQEAELALLTAKGMR